MRAFLSRVLLLKILQGKETVWRGHSCEVPGYRARLRPSQVGWLETQRGTRTCPWARYWDEPHVLSPFHDLVLRLLCSPFACRVAGVTGYILPLVLVRWDKLSVPCLVFCPSFSAYSLFPRWKCRHWMGVSLKCLVPHPSSFLWDSPPWLLLPKSTSSLAIACHEDRRVLSLHGTKHY